MTYLLINLGIPSAIFLVYTLTVEKTYKVLTWRDASSYLLVAGSLAAVVITHLIGQVLWYKCKVPYVVAKKNKVVSVSENAHVESNTL